MACELSLKKKKSRVLICGNFREFDFKALAREGSSVFDTYFPLESEVGRVNDSCGSCSEPTLLPPPLQAPQSPIAPASVHRIFSSVDSLGHLPPHYATVLATASSVVHVAPTVVAAIVEAYEHRLVGLAESLRKANNSSI